MGVHESADAKWQKDWLKNPVKLSPPAFQGVHQFAERESAACLRIETLKEQKLRHLWTLAEPQASVESLWLSVVQELFTGKSSTSFLTT